jgi:archaellum component FlaC
MKRKRDIKISKQYRKYNEYHRIENGIEQKQCEDCKEWLDMNSKNFGSAKGNKDGFNHKCRKCKKKHDREYYIENQEHIIETTKNWI